MVILGMVYDCFNHISDFKGMFYGLCLALQRITMDTVVNWFIMVLLFHYAVGVCL